MTTRSALLLRRVCVLVTFAAAALPALASGSADLARGSEGPAEIVVHAGCTGRPNGSECDDFNPCTAGDSCLGGTCAGTPSSPMPTEIERLEFSKVGSDVVISWEVPAGSVGVDVVRGKTIGGAVSPLGVGQLCLGRGLDPSSTSIIDPIDPPSGIAYWYLARGTNACGMGPWGIQRADGTDRVRLTECGCTPDPTASGSTRYADHYITVTDRLTCLEWEKKATVSTLHDPYLVVDWGEANAWVPIPPNWIQAVNQERFGGHGDWRLPTSWGPPTHRGNTSPEIESLLLNPCPGFPTPCIDPVFGYTPNHGTQAFYPAGPAESTYWSGSTAFGSPYGAQYAWAVNFISGDWIAVQKQFNGGFVRAVRGGF